MFKGIKSSITFIRVRTIIEVRESWPLQRAFVIADALSISLFIDHSPGSTGLWNVKRGNAILTQIAVVVKPHLRNSVLALLLTFDELFLLVFLDVNPIVDIQIVFVEMVADMLEPHVPRTRLDAFSLLDEFVTEAAPKMMMPFSPQVHITTPRLDLLCPGFISMADF